jgi:hypothetical protein
MNTGFATGQAAPAALLGRSFDESRQGLQTWSESREAFERCNHSQMQRLLKCRLAWYGLRLIEVGSLCVLTNDTLTVDPLLQGCGAVLCRPSVWRNQTFGRPGVESLAQLAAATHSK